MPDGACADLFQRKFQLRAAIAPQRTQHVPGQALRVHAHERRRLAVQIAAHQRDRFFLRPAALETINRESPVTRGQFGLRHIAQLRSACFS